IESLWNRFWSGGIANPLTAIEQITYLVFLKRLEDLDLERQRAARISQGMTRDIGKIPYRVATRAYAQWLATDEQAAQRRRRLFTRALGLEEGSANPLEFWIEAQRAA